MTSAGPSEPLTNADGTLVFFLAAFNFEVPLAYSSFDTLARSTYQAAMFINPSQAWANRSLTQLM